MKIIVLILSAGLFIQAAKFGIRGRISDQAGIRGPRRGKQAAGIFRKKIGSRKKLNLNVIQVVQIAENYQKVTL